VEEVIAICLCCLVLVVLVFVALLGGLLGVVVDDLPALQVVLFVILSWIGRDDNVKLVPSSDNPCFPQALYC